MLSALLSVSLNGCFTGVESTPKITPKEVRKQNVVETPETRMFSERMYEPPRDWSIGKRFYIGDNRAARGADRIEPFYSADSIAGRMATLTAIDSTITIAGQSEIMLTLFVPAEENTGSVEMSFTTGLNSEQWYRSEKFVIPHLIEISVVDSVRNRLEGKELYILPARRIGNGGIDTIGTRYQPVKITNVLPASEATPIKITFVDKEGHLASVLMTIGDATVARRNFETLFALESPRTRYKQISDENWELICHSRVRLGMTPEECRLALGSPDNYTRIPTTAGMVERWSYENGVYLIFEDGALAKFRQ